MPKRYRSYPPSTKYILLYLQVLTHHQPFSKPFSQCLCYSAHIHGFIFLPSHCLTLVQRIVFQLCCAIFLTLSWSPTGPLMTCTDHEHTGWLVSSWTHNSPNQKAFTLSERICSQIFKCFGSFMSLRYGLKDPRLRETSAICPAQSNFPWSPCSITPALVNFIIALTSFWNYLILLFACRFMPDSPL